MIFSIIKTGFKTCIKFIGKHSPEILMSLGTGGFIATTIWAVKATPKALQMKNDAENEKGEELTPLETVKSCWKPYIPAAIIGAASLACFFGAHGIGVHRTALLASAYATTKETLKEYQNKVAETIGKEEEQKIRKDIGRDHLQLRKEELKSEYQANGEMYPCLDEMTGQIFQSNKFILEHKELQMKDMLRGQMIVYKSEWLNLLGLRKTSDGDDLVWTEEDEFGLLVTPSDIDGVLCYSIEYETYPHERHR